MIPCGPRARCWEWSMTSRHKSVEPEIVIFIVPIATLLLQRLLHSNPRPRPQPFSHVAVLDLEATCLRGERIRPQEVIEVACLLLRCPAAVGDGDGEGGAGSSEVSLFYRLVRPVKRPRLSPFCTSLTGVTQAMVDGAEEFPKVCWVCVLLQRSLGSCSCSFYCCYFCCCFCSCYFCCCSCCCCCCFCSCYFCCCSCCCCCCCCCYYRSRWSSLIQSSAFIF